MNKNTHIIELSSYTSPIISEDNREDWVDYGVDNNYYQFLIDRFTNSATNNAVINNICKLIYGRGLSSLDASRKPNEYAQMLTLFQKDDVRKLVVDLKMLGQCALQIHYSKGRKSVLKTFHIPVHLLRAEKCNKDGEIEAYYYSDNWNDTKKYKPTRLDAFGFGSSDVEILYIQPYSVGMKYYSLVDYVGALDYTVLEEKISEYLINEVSNHFSPTSIINFNNGTPTDEQKEQISNEVIRKLTGSKGKKVVVSFNDNVDAKTTIDSVPLDDAPAHYNYLSEEARNKILVGHNVTSPLLFGISSSNGFSSNADELKNSAILFDNMVIRPFQELLCDSFDKVLSVNNISLNLFFKRLNVLDTDGELTQAPQEVNTQMSADFNLDEYLQEIGEDIQKGWIVLDERDVEIEDEDILDAHLSDIENELEDKLNKKTVLSKLVNLVSTGTARPTAISSQDKKVKDKYFKVRYKYAGNPTPDRAFCKAMLSANKLYRKEDLEAMEKVAVNPGFGEFGSDKYSIWKYKGGARCHHKFQRVTMMLDLNANTDTFKEIGTRAAEIKGFKVTNPFEVSIYPNNLPLKGFSPRNTNLPSDVK
jgi:hypothetical protein